MAKSKSQPPLYKREFCVQEEGTRIFLHTVVHANRPISEDELLFKAAAAARECASLYGGKWIAHAGMTGEQMVIKRQELRKETT